MFFIIFLGTVVCCQSSVAYGNKIGNQKNSCTKKTEKTVVESTTEIIESKKNTKDMIPTAEKTNLTNDSKADGDKDLISKEIADNQAETPTNPFNKNSSEKKDIQPLANKTMPVDKAAQAIKNNVETTKKNNQREITVTNAITKEMTGKYFCFKTYYPDSFSIVIDKKELSYEKERKVTIENNRLPIEYIYNFANGYRKGIRQVDFEIPETVTQCTLKFSWEQDSYILIDNARFMSVKDIE